MTDHDLSELLDRAADDSGVPLRTDGADLLRRAHHRRTSGRTRLAGAGVVAVAAVTAAVLVLPSLGDHPRRSSAPADRPTHRTSPTASPAPRPAAGLGPVEVLDRCRPQLAAQARAAGDPDPASSARWRLVRPTRAHTTGSLVLLSDGPLVPLQSASPKPPRQPVLCLVPAAGDRSLPPASAYHPTAAQPARLVDWCAEVAGTPLLLSGAYTYDQQAQIDHGRWPASILTDAPDLSHGRLLTATTGAAGTIAVVRGTSASFTCTVPSVSGGLGIDLSQTGSRQLAFQAGITGSKEAPSGVTWSTAALLEPAAARVVLRSAATGEQRSYPVRHGAVAILFVTHGGPGIVHGAVTWTVLDASGHVLRHGDALDL